MTALCYDEKESRKKNSEEIAFAATVRALPRFVNKLLSV